MYIVIGATGNTGSIVTKKLLAQGQRVRALSRQAEHLKALQEKGAEAYVADAADKESLIKAFTGARCVYVMLPPNAASPDYHRDQNRIVDAIGGALESADVPYAVALSSIGAEKQDKTGPVMSLHNLEKRLNKIAKLNVLYLRAGYFMENTLAQAGIIRQLGGAGGPLRPDLKLPMIASQDVGNAAADELLKLDFRQKQVRELHGQRDISMSEVASVIGKAIGNPELGYRQLGDEQVRPAMVQAGFSMNMADVILEMTAGLNSGYMHFLEPRSERNTTPTAYETFVTEKFIPAYRAQAQAA